MSRSTAAVILPSAATLSPWGDPGWRFHGAMQVVEDGPDHLYAQWPTLDGEDHPDVAPFAALVLRDEPHERAADIAVMVFALLQIEEWHQLHGWRSDLDDRRGLHPALTRTASRYTDMFKLAVVETRVGAVGGDVIRSLQTLGLASSVFRAQH